MSLAPRVIVERSDVSVRKDDGLEDVVAVHRGEVSEVLGPSDQSLFS